ncbi:ATP-binding protein [Candidatus Woesearchaeota archaeon]|nr:ATP-binding protein [Candidatus Woesearchaeota archaeon]
MEMIDRLIRQNPWWEGREVSSIKALTPRELYTSLLNYKKDKQIISVVGLRRVGKTTLLYQMINDLLRENEPKHLFYFSFDELLGKEPEIIETILSLYETEILKKELKGVYVFFDEITHVKDWQIILKRYYDLGGIKFFISGSSSIFLKKSKESLAGRIYEFELLPLSFREFLTLKNISFQDTKIQKSTLKKELVSYLTTGGFPEMIRETDFEKIGNYVKSIVEKIIFYDIPQVYDVAEPAVLRELFEIIARKPGSLIEYATFASALKVTYQTVSKYVGYLESAFLVRFLYNYRGSPVARARKAKKAYLGTPSLAAAFSSEKELLILLPQLAENAVVSHLGAKFFWREYYEIDVVHNNLLIEVKFSEDPEIKNALAVAKKLKGKELLVITKDTDDVTKKKNIQVTFIPLWKWLLAG